MLRLCTEISCSQKITSWFVIRWGLNHQRHVCFFVSFSFSGNSAFLPTLDRPASWESPLKAAFLGAFQLLQQARTRFVWPKMFAQTAINNQLKVDGKKQQMFPLTCLDYRWVKSESRRYLFLQTSESLLLSTVLWTHYRLMNNYTSLSLLWILRIRRYQKTWN